MQLQTRSDGHELLLQLERSNWMLAAISKVHSAMIRARTEQQLYVGACEALTLQGAFELAWIGVPEHDEKISIKVRAKCGRAVAYLDGIDISWAAGALGDGPTGRAARSGQLQSVEDLMTSADFEPWRLRAAKFQLHSAFALPIKLADGTVAAVLSIYSNLVAAFSPSEEQLLIRFAEDIGYGVESLRVRAAYQTALGKTERQNVRIAGLLEDSVRVLGAAMEKRDPYTAGHQQRVAALSVAIAQEMGMDPDQTQGLRLAALVHDLGKIRIPTEILVKPGKLNDLEWQMLQEHPTVGFEILRPVEFPWPIAEAVRQHHERLDGSGYPHGLRGEQISREARIIGVADIVESVSSDRPYRAALGLEIALHEILKLAPEKLDADVVNACVRVVRANGFKFDVIAP